MNFIPITLAQINWTKCYLLSRFAYKHVVAQRKASGSVESAIECYSYVDGDLICDALLNGVQSASRARCLPGTGWQYFEAMSRVGGKSHKGKLLVLSLPKVSHLATI